MNNSNISKNNLSGTRTQKNLITAYNDEAKAHTKYELFSAAAYEEGMATVGDSMWDLSHQEKEHAEIFADYLGKIGDTQQNLDSAISEESYAADSMYPEFARIADEEGFHEIAEKFRLIGGIENNHKDILKNILTDIRDNTLYGGMESDTEWFCTNCGYVAQGSDAPDICPVCSYGKGYFIVY